jgi:hypothetical protein
MAALNGVRDCDKEMRMIEDQLEVERYKKDVDYLKTEVSILKARLQRVDEFGGIWISGDTHAALVKENQDLKKELQNLKIKHKGIVDFLEKVMTDLKNMRNASKTMNKENK